MIETYGVTTKKEILETSLSSMLIGIAFGGLISTPQLLYSRGKKKTTQKLLIKGISIKIALEGMSFGGDLSRI